MIITRRTFVLGVLAAPAIIRTPGLIMPIKPLIIVPEVPLDLTAMPPGLYSGVAIDTVEKDGVLTVTWQIGERIVKEKLRL